MGSQGLPFHMSGIHRWNWKFQHLFLGKLREESIPDNQELS